MSESSKTLQAIHLNGEPVKEYSIEIGPRFLELFSLNLYRSPNKAFEELIANSWDAEATAVYISISEDLKSDAASIWVLDNGISMDLDGIQTLWKIASGHKRTLENPKRPQIGKFGIGKLATYILASEITYICKSEDGVIRTVPLNYRDIEGLQEGLHSEKVPVPVREITESQLDLILKTVPNGQEVLDLIASGVPFKNSPFVENEYHHPEPVAIEPPGTWTLALLTSLRETGHAIQRGRLRQMLRSALPLSSQVSIVLNDELLESKKVDTEPQVTWVLGKDLGLSAIVVEDPDDPTESTTAAIEEYADEAFPYITIQGIEGRIHGQFSLYKSRISGGKSQELGTSNGFFVNVLGRVINQEQVDFGLENLNHSAWAQFRATVRADGLDKDLGVERNGLRDSSQVRIFKQFLMAAFNKARNALKDARMAEWPRAGDILDGSWQSIPMKPLAEIVSERLSTGKGLPGSIHSGGVQDLEGLRKEWDETVKTNPGALISTVRSDSFGDQIPFSRYELQTREVLVNESHPYFVERSRTLEERQIIQEFALTDFLTELYLIGNNVDPVALDEGRAFRDEFLRLLAQLNRRTGGQIAQMLLEATDRKVALEEIVGEALDYIGFNITPIGGNGEPEGIAQAPLSLDREIGLQPYKISYDAKSTSKPNGHVSNKEVGPGRLARHRRNHEADYTLVIAPDFESGALQEECKESKVTPMRAEDLGQLLIHTAMSGTVDFVKFTSLFELYDPDHVHSWVKAYIAEEDSERHLSLGDLLWAFGDIGIEGPDELETSVIAHHLRRVRFRDVYFPSNEQVRDAVVGLSVLLPAIVRTSGKQVYLSASPETIRNALVEQLQLLPESLRQNFDPILFELGGETVEPA